MDSEETAVEQPKKGRVRRKQIINEILKQMHFYFSDANLSKDRFLKQCLNESEYIDVSVFLTFNKIRKMTTCAEDIIKAVRKSDLLEVNEDSTKIRRSMPHSPKANEDECTIYVQTLQPDVTQDWLIDTFSEFGKVDYVSLPKYTHSKLNKGFSFIEFANVEGALAALSYFDSLGLRISTKVDAEQICSNIVEEHSDRQKESGVKRKHSDDSKEGEVSETPVKKLKTESSGHQDDSKSNRITKRKAQIKELALQILPKNEWKKLRNRYWDMQRKKMKQLKQHLNKRIGQQSRAKNGEETKMNVMAEKPLNGFELGLIVKIKLSASCTDAKSMKNELKNADPNIVYVDVPTTLASDEVFMRFNSAENAKAHCLPQENSKGVYSVLSGQEEKEYWEKIEESREKRLYKDAKKQRGRDKLLKRAERELGKHIRFEEEDG